MGHEFHDKLPLPSQGVFDQTVRMSLIGQSPLNWPSYLSKLKTKHPYWSDLKVDTVNIWEKHFIMMLQA